MECSMAKRMKLDSSVSNDCSDSINGEPPVNDVINKVQRDKSQTCPMTKRMKLDDDECQNPYASPVNEENESIEQKLRHFDVLDEVDGDESDSDGSGGYRSSESDIDDDELDNLLNEGLPEDLRDHKKDVQYEERFKTVLEEKGHNHFEVLPEGWIKVSHNSGLPIYLHKTQRVCTVSKPYFLGPGSVRKHEIPITAIPCLNYRRALDKEDVQRKASIGETAIAADETNSNNCDTELNENGVVEVENGGDGSTVAVTNGVDMPTVEATNGGDVSTAEPTNGHSAVELPASVDGDTVNSETPPAAEAEAQPNGDGNNDAEKLQEPTDATTTRPVNVLPGVLGTAKIETVTENTKAQSLTPQQINEYCKQLFIFKKLRVMRFNSWSARRKFTKNKKNIKNLQRPMLPDGTKLITFPVIDDCNNARAKKEWIMNPNGKSYVCILHEYVQHALKKQPVYDFKELENAATPYSATVSINDLKYGIGFGTSKKQAKSEAARETLEILIPEMRDKISSEKKAKGQSIFKDLSVFDEIRIEDPRVNEFCTKTTEPSPHAILQTCLQRNFGLGDAKIEYHVNPVRNKRNEFTITVGKHKATVICRNKRDGKQRASQAILQILHPHIKTWGSLLRLYGNDSVKSFKEKKQEEQEITVLQSKAAINQPNYAILDKLKLEMTKLMDIRAAVQPIGKFVPPEEIDLPLASSSNLRNVEL